jgi:hypothetical protein
MIFLVLAFLLFAAGCIVPSLILLVHIHMEIEQE